MPGIDESKKFIPLRIAVLTVSDTRDLADDKSGQTLADRIVKAGHQLADRAIVMRRGRAVGEEVPRPENRARLVSLIVGGDV